MAAGKGTPPRYSPPAVERAVLEVVAELHPRRLKEPELAGKIVADRDDPREVGTFDTAIRNLTEFGLIRTGADETVEPTPALLRIVALFDIP